MLLIVMTLYSSAFSRYPFKLYRVVFVDMLPASRLVRFNKPLMQRHFHYWPSICYMGRTRSSRHLEHDGALAMVLPASGLGSTCSLRRRPIYRFPKVWSLTSWASFFKDVFAVVSTSSASRKICKALLEIGDEGNF
jgi:hypothetical protein